MAVNINDYCQFLIASSQNQFWRSSFSSPGNTREWIRTSFRGMTRNQIGHIVSYIIKPISMTDARTHQATDSPVRGGGGQIVKRQQGYSAWRNLTQIRRKCCYEGAIKKTRLVYAPAAMHMQRVINRTDIGYPVGLSKEFGQCFG
jgi:hypothetical protein